MKIKKQLFNECKLYVEKRERTIREIMTSNKKALFSETKSSAGDKHETGRAMLQLEMEKASQQIAVVQQMKEVLHRISTEDVSEVIRLGSLVHTNKASYYLSISIGAVAVENEMYFVISSSSPIGKLLLGKRVNDIVEFNGQQIKITQVN
ncbi:3-oxoacyl-ACP synthase [Tenacibaculum sp. SZ-18]|uniref:GreA/GreB family elongation factor n=1 Tax=Tenacibaculum sp. SZ-18 TaxID=754423 RepID=UPI000C2D3449|nr:GreA/GreB family elongation factor [Tenacibaculum sp. SZ-18]AUC16596.1 3-oxoacyl-ACP synthase [Tenacibaculum sp. SZ-18]